MQCISIFKPYYKDYDRQKCFVAHSLTAKWSEDLKSACAAILPKFNLEPWYAVDHFDPTQPLRDKVVELIANSRYGIYDISSWQDQQGNWQLPHNVFIELGIAIALNRPTLLLRHSSNTSRSLSACLQGVEIVTFAGDFTLKKELEKQLPQWLDVPPDRDWLNRFCIFGNRVCSFREQHPCSQQWGQKTLRCHISDGLDKQNPNYCQSECEEIRGTFEEIFNRYSDLEFSYLDEQSVVDGYQYLLCSHCQEIRSTPLAIYRISPTTSAETYISIGISIVLEKVFSYKIPKVFLVQREQDLPSLLRGYEIVEATSTQDIKKKLKVYIPNVIKLVRETSWRPGPLPFIETKIPLIYQSSLSEVNDLNETEKGDLNEIWQLLLDHLPRPSRALLREHAQLTVFKGREAKIGIRNKNLARIAQSKLPDVEAAFQKVFDRKVAVSLHILATPEAKTTVFSHPPSRQASPAPIETPSPSDESNLILYHRFESPTQTPGTAIVQEKSLKIWGQPSKFVGTPYVQAYKGPLPKGARGIEFRTNVAPDASTTTRDNIARWSGTRVGVNTQGNRVCLKILTIENHQPFP